MNPVKIKDTNKRRRSSTSLSPNKSQNKAAKNALELSNELSGLIERLGDGSVHENELNKSGSVMAEPLISSSQVSNSSTTKKCFLQKNKNLKRRRVFAQIGEYKSEQECDCYIRSTHPFPIVTSHNDFVRCTLCEDHDKHKMSAILFSYIKIMNLHKLSNKNRKSKKNRKIKKYKRKRRITIAKKSALNNGSTDLNKLNNNSKSCDNNILKSANDLEQFCPYLASTTIISEFSVNDGWQEDSGLSNDSFLNSSYCYTTSTPRCSRSTSFSMTSLSSKSLTDDEDEVVTFQTVNILVKNELDDDYEPYHDDAIENKAKRRRLSEKEQINDLNSTSDSNSENEGDLAGKLDFSKSKDAYSRKKHNQNYNASKSKFGL